MQKRAHEWPGGAGYMYNIDTKMLPLGTNADIHG
jgi:hypothetical protein